MILLSDEEKLAVVGGMLDEDPWDVDAIPGVVYAEHPWDSDASEHPWDENE